VRAREWAPPLVRARTSRTTLERREMYAILDPEEVEARAKGRGLNRRALAEEAGISMDTMRRIERGEKVTFYTARKVAGVFGVHSREIAEPALSERLRAALARRPGEFAE
jgi:transcriptional regulator with XRE-family HTH domain